MSDTPEVEMTPEYERYGSLLQLRLESSDKTHEARKFLNSAGEAVARMLMQTWLAHPGTYDIDIKVTMERVK